MLLDKDIREPLFDFLEERYGKIRILEEKTIGRSRADVMMVLPSKLVGIEIKSDADSYARLRRQVEDYDLYFDANIVVVGSTHAAHVAEHVPETWGIISVEEVADEQVVSDEQETINRKPHGLNPDFYVVREMRDNPKAELERTIRVLWRPELANIQKKYGLPAYKEKSKEFVRQVIVERLPEEIVHEQISEALFERDYTMLVEQIQTYRQEQAAKRGKTTYRKRKKYKRKKRDA